ncbi:hypothetical protein Tter_2409 [Thermobaculum terrenum ATCC BAA-798]|uniref:Uncharacterized protein n=1 Tax=Thermobaculum terrenum (strain ATCC BAA-798 / CCMEE 7001 / YNP1) TaxID=525904 RepID=D1CHT3_THET1|nr:hypothetical protein [Thermobaculum terrenum]ACZ43304.1 hypothetical protein Tter_2409 [Thermobaculum terrenum ATCC BAA-798]
MEHSDDPPIWHHLLHDEGLEASQGCPRCAQYEQMLLRLEEELSSIRRYLLISDTRNQLRYLALRRRELRDDQDIVN